VLNSGVIRPKKSLNGAKSVPQETLVDTTSTEDHQNFLLAFEPINDQPPILIIAGPDARPVRSDQTSDWVSSIDRQGVLNDSEGASLPGSGGGIMGSFPAAVVGSNGSAPLPLTSNVAGYFDIKGNHNDLLDGELGLPAQLAEAKPGDPVLFEETVRPPVLSFAGEIADNDRRMLVARGVSIAVLISAPFWMLVGVIIFLLM
jgi:hypothetical protein